MRSECANSVCLQDWQKYSYTREKKSKLFCLWRQHLVGTWGVFKATKSEQKSQLVSPQLETPSYDVLSKHSECRDYARASSQCKSLLVDLTADATSGTKWDKPRQAYVNVPLTIINMAKWFIQIKSLLYVHTICTHMSWSDYLFLVLVNSEFGIFDQQRWRSDWRFLPCKRSQC